jgi:nicotinamide-nucleotide amidase
MRKYCCIIGVCSEGLSFNDLGASQLNRGLQGYHPPMACDPTLFELATSLSHRMLALGWRLATAESCTGGWISKILTDLPGSSRWFECGFVCYSNAAKERDLGVSSRTLEVHGAVSEAVAREMAGGALGVTGAQLALAVTGIAGPDGGSEEKPVGTVWFGVACYREGQEGPDPSVPAIVTEGRRFGGDREMIRRLSVEHVLKLALRLTNAAPVLRSSS